MNKYEWEINLNLCMSFDVQQDCEKVSLGKK